MHAEGIEHSGLREIIPEAHAFLAAQGCINLGLPAGEPPKEAEQPEGAPALAPEELVAAVYALLKTVDLEVSCLRGAAVPGTALMHCSHDVHSEQPRHAGTF